jgi:hypothetical protein
LTNFDERKSPPVVCHTASSAPRASCAVAIHTDIAESSSLAGRMARRPAIACAGERLRTLGR